MEKNQRSGRDSESKVQMFHLYYNWSGVATIATIVDLEFYTSNILVRKDGPLTVDLTKKGEKRKWKSVVSLLLLDTP